MTLVRVLGVGAGGHAKGVLETLAVMGGYEVVGLLDPKRELWGTSFHGVQVLGDDDLLEPQYHAGVSDAFIGLGGIGDTGPRRRLYVRARRAGFDIVPAVHPSAVVSPSAQLGTGPTILAQAVVGPDVALGQDVIVNTAAVVDHDCRIGDHVHVATGARLAGGVTVGDLVHIGAGATVVGAVEIGEGAIVGAGAVVVRDVPPGTIVAGVPARELRRVEGTRA